MDFGQAVWCGLYLGGVYIHINAGANTLNDASVRVLGP